MELLDLTAVYEKAGTMVPAFLLEGVWENKQNSEVFLTVLLVLLILAILLVLSLLILFVLLILVILLILLVLIAHNISLLNVGYEWWDATTCGLLPLRRNLAKPLRRCYFYLVRSIYSKR